MLPNMSRAALPAASAVPMEVEAGQLVPIDLATPRCGPLVREGSTDAPDSEVVTGIEEQLLELATSASHADQAPAEGAEAKDVHCSQEAAFNTTRLNLLQPGGPGWVPRCWCGPRMAANMRMSMGCRGRGASLVLSWQESERH